MELDPPPNASFESLSNRYHWHRERAGLGVKEHGLLVRSSDQSNPLLPSLNLAIYLDHLRSAHNVGSIIRTVEAFQLGAIFLSEQTPDPGHRQVQQASMGAYEWVKVERCIHLDDLPRPWIALETAEQAAPLPRFSWPKEPFTLIVGNEEYGCSQAILEQADELVEIPLCGRKNSLNVANALAIAAYSIHQSHSVYPI